MADESRSRKRAYLRSRLPAIRAAWWAGLWPWTGAALGLIGFVLLVLAGFGDASRNPVFQFHMSVFDFLLRQREVEVLDGPGSPIALVGLDDESRKRRDVMAEGIRVLLDAGATAVVLDVQFTDPEVTAVRIREALAEVNPGASRTTIDAIADRYDETAHLLQAVADPRVVGSFFAHGLSFGPSDLSLPPSVEEDILRVFSALDCEQFRAASDIVLDRPEFLETFQNHGNVRLEPEWDGFIRRYPLFIRVGESLYPSLAVVAATLPTEGGQATVECDGPYLKAFSIGADYTIPLERTGDYPDALIWVNYGGTFEQSFRHWTPFASLVPPMEVPASEYASTRDRRVNELRDRFDGKVVFVGLRSDYNDKYPTFNDAKFPGVAIHATVAHTLMTRRWLHRPAQAVTLEALACILVGLAVTLVFRRWGSSWLILLAPGLLAAGYLGSIQILGRGFLVDLVIPGFVGSMAVLLCGALRFIVEQQKAEQERARAEQEQMKAEREKERREASERELGAFLPPAVATLVLEQPELLQPKRQEISVLFSDIRSFTTTAEGMAPEALTVMLHEYLTWMTEIVMTNHGTLDKYIGDAVMALFGAPIADDKHARWACATALEMMEALEGLHEKWAAEGRPLLQIGIGINTGQVIVGKMGSKRKPEYTCIGDDVNFASRAEGLTKAYGATIIVGENTRKQAGEDFLFRDLGPVKVKGKTVGVRIYELIGTRSGVTETAWIDTFHQALNAFLLRDWPKAEELFERVSTQRGKSDGPSKAFLVWTRSFRVHPPDEAWDGTLERAEK